MNYLKRIIEYVKTGVSRTPFLDFFFMEIYKLLVFCYFFKCRLQNTAKQEKINYHVMSERKFSLSYVTMKICELLSPCNHKPYLKAILLAL